MKTSKAGITMIKHYEGTKLKAYKCPAGKWTIGTGSTYWPDGTPVKEGDTVTEQGAEDLLMATLAPFERDVERLVEVPMTQGQFDALVSFAFNVGTNNLKGSTLLKVFNNGGEKYAAQEFSKWVFAAGKVLPGLVKRRESERSLFLS